MSVIEINVMTGEQTVRELNSQEIASLPPVDPNASILEQITILEAEQEKKLTPRARRELYLGIIIALGLDPNMNPGCAELASIQAQIVALRAQLRK